MEFHIEVSVSHARANLPELLDNVETAASSTSPATANAGALVPTDAAEYLDRLEDEYWSKRAKEAIESNEPSIRGQRWSPSWRSLTTGEPLPHRGTAGRPEGPAQPRQTIRRRLQRAIDDLADCPRPQGVTALAGAPGTLRIHVGDYRVIYIVRDSQLLILVIDVDHRIRIYRQP